MDKVFYDVHDVIRRNVLAGKKLKPLNLFEAIEKLGEGKIAAQFISDDYEVPPNAEMPVYIYLNANNHLIGVAEEYYRAKVNIHVTDDHFSKYLILDVTI